MAGQQQLEEITVIAKRLEAARLSIQPQIGASTYTITTESIEAQPGGANNTLNQVLYQAPGVTQDSSTAGGIHIRNEMQNPQYRINGIVLPEGLSFFGQGLDPRFANSVKLITGALPAEYGLRTVGIVDIQTKSGVFSPGGSVSMYGGSLDTIHPSAQYGGSVEGYNYYVSDDFLSTDHGIEGVTPALTQIHDRSTQTHLFGYLDKIIDGENKITVMAGSFNGPSRSRTIRRPRRLRGSPSSTGFRSPPSTRANSTKSRTKLASSGLFPTCIPGRPSISRFRPLPNTARSISLATRTSPTSPSTAFRRARY